jgi:hypothetical protein
MPINDTRAKQAIYMALQPAKSSMGFGSGRQSCSSPSASPWSIAAVWLAIEMFQ